MDDKSISDEELHTLNQEVARRLAQRRRLIRRCLEEIPQELVSDKAHRFDMSRLDEEPPVLIMYVAPGTDLATLPREFAGIKLVAIEEDMPPLRLINGGSGRDVYDHDHPVFYESPEEPPPSA